MKRIPTKKEQKDIVKKILDKSIVICKECEYKFNNQLFTICPNCEYKDDIITFEDITEDNNSIELEEFIDRFKKDYLH
jgi:hypothetical protein